MKKILLKIIIKILFWLMIKKGNRLVSAHLLKSGWVIENVGGRQFFVEPMIKPRDKVWIEFEHHYYRVYHSENRTFVSLESRLEWLQMYLFLLDYHLETKTRTITGF